MKLLKIRRFDLLVSLYIFCIITAELMGSKSFPIGTIFGFRLSASVAIFLIPILFTINDIVIEVYGKERARSIIKSGIFIIFLIFLFSILATMLPPTPRFEKSEAAYDHIFMKSMRISAASLIAFIFSEFFDVFIFAKLRQKLGKKGLWFRNNVSNFSAQFVDTAIFITLAFYAFDRPYGDNLTFILGLIIPYWLLKCFMSVIETPLVYIGVKWLKNAKEE